ncbi:hypothetical protein L6452_03856 [Arctium lappa]|uniref:Uncharacterized protein n=1 Tax=Arctium lappa TaxID=4217 RepID=A0ACB9FNE5_ARCLA|nr:hypothetical protein L6452_03856 [Arctium lappa]
MARKKPSSSASPITIGNCQVVVEAKNFNAESNQNSLQISVSSKSKIIISVAEDALGKECNDLQRSSFGENGNYYFVLVNPKDSDVQSKSLLQEILNLYVKELPSMNYAANTGKKSTFLERCVSNGKYCTLVLKSKSEEGPGEVGLLFCCVLSLSAQSNPRCRDETHKLKDDCNSPYHGLLVVAAISFQIIPADTQYAEVLLAAVRTAYQHKGIGHLTYLEMRKRLQSVGVHSIFCWADEESDGFWLKQGFVSVGQVDTKGRARRLPIKADIRKALCFPGGSTLMIAHLNKECSDNSAESLQLSSVLKPVHKPLTVSMVQSQCPGAEEVLKNNFLMDGCQDLVCLDSVECINTGNDEDGMRIRTDGDAWHYSGCVSRRNKTDGCYLDANPMIISKDEGLVDFTSTLGGPLSNIHEDNALECRLGARTTKNHGCVELLSERNCYKVMLMNIADDAKKSNLTKIIEDLGGSVTSDGRESTHVITGKVRKTLNFCTALCSGAWVISPAWLKESFREGRFVDEMPFIVKDLEYELKYRTELKGTVLRARASPGALLKGFEVCLAVHVQPPISTLSAIVRSAGGNVIRNLEKVKDSSKTIFVASEESMDEALSAVKKGIPTFTTTFAFGGRCSKSSKIPRNKRPKMAAETAAASHLHHYYLWRRNNNGRRLPFPAAASSSSSSSQPMNMHTSKSYKQLGMFSLRKKIEDSVNRAEMLGLTALEFEEAQRIKQEEMVREYDLWDDLAKSSDILIKLADSAKVVDALKDMTYKVEEAKLITELAEMDIIDYALLKQAYTASVDVSKFLDKYEMSKLLKGQYEFEGACIMIEAGSEGIRSEIWAEQLVGMYMKWAKKQGFKGRIVEKKCASKTGGIKSVIIEFEYKHAYGYLLGERGTHRMITSHPESLSEVSSAAVDVVPLFLEETPELIVDEKDLKVSYLSLCKEDQGRKGPIVQIQHSPTGLTVQSSGERNQFSNKMKALNRLKAKLLVLLKDQGVPDVTKIKNDAIIDIWHQETRRYVFRPYKLVQDVKTGIQLADPNFVLNGNLEPFISAHINNRHVCDMG